MPAPFSVRQALPADGPTLVALINTAFAVEKGDFKVDDRITSAELEQYRAHGTFLLAEVAAEVVAETPATYPSASAPEILACVFVEVLTPPGRSRAGGVAYFGLLSVSPAYQRQGLGAAMTAQAENWALARGCHAMELDVLDVRPELQPLYERMGYRILSIRPSPVPERFIKPVQFVRMRKPLYPQV